MVQCSVVPAPAQHHASAVSSPEQDRSPGTTPATPSSARLPGPPLPLPRPHHALTPARAGTLVQTLAPNPPRSPTRVRDLSRGRTRFRSMEWGLTRFRSLVPGALARGQLWVR